MLVTDIDSNWVSFLHWIIGRQVFGLTIDERLVFVGFTWLSHVAVFWTLNFLLLLCYRFKLFAKHKIQENIWPADDLTMECLRDLAIGHLIVQPLVLYYSFPLFTSFGVSLTSPIPPLYTVMRDLLVCVAANDTLFYWVHRGLHHKTIYRFIHKKHHSFKASIGIASEYAHPIEEILANTLPTISGILLMGSHAVVLWIWLAIRIAETVDAHAGYEFPFSPFRMFSFQGGASHHDFHHSHNVGCYGSFTTFWDYLMGTDAQYNDFVLKSTRNKSFSKLE